jgi:aspartate-semialdehyde dehydrogenase
MAVTPYKIGIVGAGTLLGKELNEVLTESPLAASEIVLLDEGDALGELTTTGDEVTFIQRLDQQAFERMDFVFFATAPEITAMYWKRAVAAGAMVIDLSGALASEPDVPVMAPAVSLALGAVARVDIATDLKTNAVVPAHPAAAMLALVFAKIMNSLPLKSAAVTLLEPASQYGREAMDELHQQTVNLLSFQELPKEQYDAQIAFNLLAAAGNASNAALRGSEIRIRAEYARLNNMGTGKGKLPPLVMQVAHAPAFHGYVASILLEFTTAVKDSSLFAALSEEHIEVVTDDADAPSNLSAAGQEDILVRLRAENDATKVWLWVASDNLKQAALNAVACALEMRRLRPSRQVQ